MVSEPNGAKWFFDIGMIGNQYSIIQACAQLLKKLSRIKILLISDDKNIYLGISCSLCDPNIK